VAVAVCSPWGQASAGATPEWKLHLRNADKKFRGGDFGAAATEYSGAITSAMEDGSDAARKAVKRMYLQRAKSRQKRGRTSAAIVDLGHALAEDPGFTAAQLLRATLNLEAGNCQEAVSEYEAVLNVDPRKRDAQKRLPDARACAEALQLASEAKRRGDWSAVERHIGEALASGRANKAPGLLVQRAEARMQLQQFPEAAADCQSAIRLDKGMVEAYRVRGDAFYAQQEWKTAVLHQQQALRLDPENRLVKHRYKLASKVQTLAEEAARAEAAGDIDAAVRALQELELVDPGHQPMVLNTCAKLAKLLLRKRDHRGAIEAGNRALAIQRGHGEALESVVDSHMALGEFDEALGVLRSHGGNDQRSHMLRQRVQKAKEMADRVDYYQVLGVPRTASGREIKKAYRTLALEWHPDKARTDEMRVEFDVKFKAINVAYGILSDDEKRAKFDRGEDPEKPQQQQQQGHPFGGGGFPGGGGQRFSFRFG